VFEGADDDDRVDVTFEKREGMSEDFTG